MLRKSKWWSLLVCFVFCRIYTIALGLDILGNPFGLIRGIGSGVRDLFYEPYEGALEGPDEFLSGLGSGVQSLVCKSVGKSVGGVLGTGQFSPSLSFSNDLMML